MAKGHPAIVQQKGLTRDIEVDGGSNMDNVNVALAAGANVIVAGSAVFRNDICVNAKRFMSKLEEKADS